MGSIIANIFTKTENSTISLKKYHMSSESDGIFCKWQYFLPTKFFDDKVFTDKVCLSFTNYTVTYLSKKRETNKHTNKQIKDSEVLK